MLRRCREIRVLGVRRTGGHRGSARGLRARRIIRRLGGVRGVQPAGAGRLRVITVARAQVRQVEPLAQDDQLRAQRMRRHVDRYDAHRNDRIRIESVAGQRAEVQQILQRKFVIRAHVNESHRFLEFAQRFHQDGVCKREAKYSGTSVIRTFANSNKIPWSQFICTPLFF